VAQQERNHNSTSGIVPIAGRAGIDQNPAACRGSQHRSVALTNVKKM
jgi:hypothetical protein